ncbi:hypothetical protein C7S18_14035 [Ahniella affigens]|uniref:HTH tetR-type domain-containing protein n=1 Tax=Ahniella affigens TaxID=2021234 RepID=A0A2P1PTS8_9GAMM|nr:TetR/AcrR family transcriptional regulator [Ahniella affigens]AVP98243.1 hypothetical protein C7S18_14035 [Ahniella affigens]
MNRPAKAKDKILAAARKIVETKGAGHLTFDELSTESGVTRGGITYHFPTKELLLRGLIEADLQDWEDDAEMLAGHCSCPRQAEMLGQIRCQMGQQDEDHKRFVTGMMSAAMVDPGLLEPVRAYHHRKFASWEWHDQDLFAYLLLLAAEGTFWQDFFNTNAMPGPARERLFAWVEHLAQHPELWPLPPAGFAVADSHDPSAATAAAVSARAPTDSSTTSG